MAGEWITGADGSMVGIAGVVDGVVVVVASIVICIIIVVSIIIWHSTRR